VRLFKIKRRPTGQWGPAYKKSEMCGPVLPESSYRFDRQSYYGRAGESVFSPKGTSAVTFRQ